LLLTFLIAKPALAGHESGAESPWQLGLAYSFNEAEHRFSRSLRETPDNRSDQLGRAAALLNVQPRSGDRVVEARALLDRIVVENSHDDVGVTSRYLLARIADAHQHPRDQPTAARLYRSLLTEHTAHPLAQAAGVKLALILLYDTGEANLDARFDAAESLLGQVTQRGPRSDLLVILGRSALHFKRPSVDALRWFSAARVVGFSMRGVEADTLVSLSQLAAESGDTALERECLIEFVEAFPRDNRAAWLRERLARLRPSP
jgi:hypothetical protein